MKSLLIILTVVIAKIFANNNNECKIPDKCYQISLMDNIQNKSFKGISCFIESGSKIDFNISFIASGSNDCKSLRKKPCEIFFRTSRYRPKKLGKNAFDLVSFSEYLTSKELWSINIIFDSFTGFDIDLFELTQREQMSFSKLGNTKIVACYMCVFDFYKDNKRIESCDEMTASTDLVGPRSILQLFSIIPTSKIQLFLTEFKRRICPLAFKNFFAVEFMLSGSNSYFSQRLLKFANDTTNSSSNLNSYVRDLVLEISNVRVDFELINPMVFEQLNRIYVKGHVDFIHPDLFVKFTFLFEIYIQTEYFKSIMHKGGIGWVKNIKRGLNVNQSDSSSLWRNLEKTSFISLDCYTSANPTFLDLFPEEDFCLYKDFPFNQLVWILMVCRSESDLASRTKLTCTHLFLIQYYKPLFYFLNIDNHYYTAVKSFINLEEFEKMSTCNFKQRLDKCNKSEFEIKPVGSIFKIGEDIEMVKVVFHLFSYPLSIFGIVTNILIIVTISSKQNKAEFKEFKQYNYLRINSIINCIILVIHITTWITRCEFPYQVFCSQIRKEIFFQYFKIIVQDVILVSLRFLNNFTYIAFAFNRISLIGKDHNKLVKFVSDVGINKYMIVTFIISVGLSVIKFFSYRINYGQSHLFYPINFDYQSNMFKDVNLTYFILNSISDLLNYVVFLFVHLFIDIGMVVKLRETLIANFERSKSLHSKDQLEKKMNENESVLNKAIWMVILNTSLGFLLKLPACINSIVMLVNQIIKNNDYINHHFFGRFYMRFCIDAGLCDMFLQLSNFLYLVSISIGLFFYLHFDKNIKVAFKRIIPSSK